jgi:hypothetical protein
MFVAVLPHYGVELNDPVQSSASLHVYRNTPKRLQQGSCPRFGR